MSLNATYDFWPNKVSADIFVEWSTAAQEPRITVAPICLMKDGEDWEITWGIIIKSEPGITAEFASNGIVFGDSKPPKFQVKDSHIDGNDTTRWTAICNSQVAAVNMAPYKINLMINGKPFSHDPSIAVTTDPIPPSHRPHFLGP